MKTPEKLFRRETSSKEFIPMIDGLRFLAILLVVLFHINGYLITKTENFNFSGEAWLINHPPEIFNYGNQGVQLFFVISGFILAIPFMRFYLSLSEKKITLRDYFIRRLTRLEPPYILSLIILFGLLLTMENGHPFIKLLLSLLASVLYVHNLVFPGEPPLINVVTWSLEIEVQFYILAPLLVWAICLIKNKLPRRVLLIILIVGCSILGWLIEVFWKVETLSVAAYLQYFIAGILLCDIYLTENLESKAGSNLIAIAAGFGLLTGIICFQTAKSPELFLRILSPFLIFGFYLIVFYNSWWRRIFSVKWLTLIGGMCYTIYLFHYQIIAAVGKLTVNRLFVSNFTVYYLLQTAVFISAILLFSAIYFLTIEKPCMKKDWYRMIFRRPKTAENSPLSVEKQQIYNSEKYL